MATVSSTGGSTIDVSSIVSQLMQVERQPLARLDTREASYNSQLSAYGSVKSAASIFQATMGALSTASVFQTIKAGTSDAGVVGVSASPNAAPGSYSVKTTKLAQQQKLVAVGAASTDAAIGSGTLTIDFGTITDADNTFNSTTGKYSGSTFFTPSGASKSITIDSSNNSLTGIRDAINAAGIGATATILNDGSTSPYRLVITSDASGVANSVRIGVAGDAGLSTLLAHDPGGTQNLAQTVTAQDAQLTVDGVPVTKPTNTLTDVIPGLTLSLLQPSSEAATTINVTRDGSGAQALAKNFVDAFNALNSSLTKLTAYNGSAANAAPLNNDVTIRSFASAVRASLNNSLSGAGSYTGLSQLGISFQRDGTLGFDASKFQTAFAKDPNNVVAVFALIANSTDSLVSYAGSTSATKAGAYAIQVSRLATHGTSVGSAVADLTITAGLNDTLQVSLNGFTDTVTLAAKTYASATELAQEVQSKINAAAAFAAEGATLTASAGGGAITLSSDRYGSASGISVTGGNGASSLMGLTPTSAAGLDVTGSIGGIAATGSGQTLTGATASDAEGLSLTVSGGATGNRGTTSFSRGYAYQLSQLADSFLSSTGGIASRTKGINDSIKSIGDQRDAMETRLALTEARYRQQYGALDALLASMQQSQNFLSQQLTMLNNLVAPARN